MNGAAAVPRYVLPDILRRSLMDKRLEDIDRSLLVLLITILEVDMYRLINVKRLSEEVHRNKTRVYKSIKNLCDTGYLAKGNRDPVTGMYSYRVHPTPPSRVLQNMPGY